MGLLPLVTNQEVVLYLIHKTLMLIIRCVCNIQSRRAVRDYYFQDPKALDKVRDDLISFHSKKLETTELVWRAMDELPYQLQAKGDKAALLQCISKLCVFQAFCAR